MLQNIATLRLYGQHASNALPVLASLQSYPVGNVQDAAAAAIKEIKKDLGTSTAATNKPSSNEASR